MKIDASEYRTLIEHLDDCSHQIYHGDADKMDSALRFARTAPAMLAALRRLLAEADFDGITQDGVDEALAVIRVAEQDFTKGR